MARSKSKELNIAPPKTIAQDLRDIQIAREQLDIQEAKLRAQLLENLQTQGVRHIKLDDGTTYIRSQRKTLVVKDEQEAYKWGEEHYSLQLDKAKAMKIMRLTGMPDIFSTKITEYLTIRKPGEKDQED